MHIGLIATVALLLLTWPVSSSQIENITCPDEENEFNVYQESTEFPTERIDKEGNFTEPKTMLDLGFELMPQDAVSCWQNRLPYRERPSHLNIIKNTTTGTVSVAEECRSYIKSWLAIVTDNVLHNLLIIIKAKTVNLFNTHFDLKQFVFGPGKLITDLDEELVGVLVKLEQDLKNGTKFPSDVEKPAYSFYNALVGRYVSQYTNIQKHYQEEKNIVLPIYPPDQVDKEFLTDLVMGTVTTGWKPVQGYLETHYRLKDVIVLIRSYFGWFANSISPLMPTIPPCFTI